MPTSWLIKEPLDRKLEVAEAHSFGDITWRDLFVFPEGKLRKHPDKELSPRVEVIL